MKTIISNGIYAVELKTKTGRALAKTFFLAKANHT